MGKYNFEGVMTYGQMFNDLLPTIQEEDVAEYLEACIQYTMDAGNMDRVEAENAVRINIGYIAGYFDTTEAARIHKLFSVVHPYLGSAENWDTMSAESIVEKGMEVGKQATEQPADAPAVDGSREAVGDALIAVGLRLRQRMGYLSDGDSHALLAYIESVEEQLAAAEAALLECTTQMNTHGNDDNWETVTMAYAQAIKDGRAVLQATGGEGGPPQRVTVSPAAKQRLMDEHGLTESDFIEGD